MMDYKETKSYELTCISPIHIGSGESLRPFEYLYDKQKGKVYLINQSKWVAMLSDKGLMEEYVVFIEGSKQLEGLNLWQWLRNKGVSNQEILASSSRCAEAPYSVLAKNKKSLNSLNSGISLPNGQLYIPGSSIKGALRNGIIYHLLNKSSRIKEYQKKVESELNDKLNIRKLKASSYIENDLLSTLCYDVKKNKDSIDVKKNKDSINSVLRGLQVSDAMPVEKYNTVVVQKLDASVKIKKSGESESRLPLCRECIRPGAKFRFTISLDLPMMKTIGISSIDEILEYAHKAKLAEINLLKLFFSADYKNQIKEAEAADFSIGAGTGFLNKTLWTGLYDDREAMVRGIKTILSDSFKKHNHFKDSGISPRTLKLAEVNGKKQMMGLCSLQEVK